MCEVNNKDITLDLGTGTGTIAYALRNSAGKIVGVDFSEDMLREARRHNYIDNVQFINADIRALPFHDNTFDIVTARMVFHCGVLSQLYMILDYADGLLSRVKNNSSKFGAVFDIVSDVFVNNIVLLGIGIGLYLQTNRLDIVIIPFLALFGMNMTVVTHNTQMLVFRDEPLRTSTIIKEIGKRQKLLHGIIIRLGLSGSFQFFIIGIGALLNKLIWSMIIIAVLQNVYWMSLVLLMYINYQNQRLLK